MTPSRGRFPLLALGIAALLAGLCGGMFRVGLGLEHIPPSMGLAHGPLMVCGFLGTLISLERAVALRKWWAFVVPLLSGVGGIVAMSGLGGSAGPLLFTLGSLGLVALYAVLLRMQPEPFLQVMALGAGAWLVGNLLWLSGAAVFEAVPWWMGFLVLTIAGERLELSRMLMHEPRVQRWFLLITALLLAALAVTAVDHALGFRPAGAALVLMSLWLAIYDVARHTLRRAGLTRFMAACLLAGYVWMAAGGALMVLFGGVVVGPLYDAMLHAVFVGFVFSMIFGHAPIIFPAVLNVPPFHRQRFYLHLILLHASLVLRVIGDLGGWMELRQWGSLINALAILLFLTSTVTAVIAEVRQSGKMSLVAGP